MRAVVQRVSGASVRVGGGAKGAIGKGLLVLAGVEEGDTDADTGYIAAKLVSMRVFPDAEGRMNLDLKDARGALLVVSQFTLLGDLRKGRRPSFDSAESPARARELYERLVERLRNEGVQVETGEFQAHMEVSLVNDGPVTFILDSRKTL